MGISGDVTPVIADEVGYVNTQVGPDADPLWREHFLQFTARWVSTMGGSGGDHIRPVRRQQLGSEQPRGRSGSGDLPWGTIFSTSYLARVPAHLAQ
jgi:hypothetical protein